MFSPRQQQGPGGSRPAEAAKYDPQSNQWMREAMESRHAIEELKEQNGKLQRELYSVNSKVNLIYECLGDLGMVDRVGDLMQKKIREFQLAQYAKQNPPSSFSNSPRPRRVTDPKLDEGVICGSTTFQQTAAFSSSYEGQVARDSFNRRNMFEAEEALGRDKFDILGKPIQQHPQPQKRRGDSIDNLLASPVTSPPRGAELAMTRQVPGASNPLGIR